MSFKELAEELGVLEGAAATALAQANGAGGEAAGAGTGNSAGTAQGPLVKSFDFTLEDGTKVVAVDGAELVKAMGDRMDSQEADLKKALGSMASMLKSLTNSVAQMAGQGRGRKATLHMPAGAGDEGNGGSTAGGAPNASEVMAKAHKAHEAGEITGLDVAVIEGYLNRGARIEQMPEPLAKCLR